MKIFKLIGAGRLIEITRADYEAILQVACKPAARGDLMRPMHGFQYLGVAYIVLPALVQGWLPVETEDER